MQLADRLHRSSRSLYHSDRRSLGNLRELQDLVDIASQHEVSELRFFTLLWHSAFREFDEFYHFFSSRMRETLSALLAHSGIVDPERTVEILAELASMFADHLYPKVEFGVDLGPLKLGFEAMKYGRLGNGLQEGPYAMRVGADGALRSTLHGPASYRLISGIRDGLAESELRARYREAMEEMP